MTARTWSVMAVAITGLMIQIVWAQQAVTPIGPLPDEATLVAPFGEANRLADRPEISPPAPPNASAPPAMAPSLVAHVRQRLGDDAVRGGRHTRDKAALQAFYGAGYATLLWVGGEGVRQLAHDVVAEIGRADDYGLEADAFALPALQVEPSPGALAAIELELSRAVLGYAHHARGGRVVGAKLGSQLVDRPVLLDPLAVLWALRSSPDKAAYLRSLHPIHPQFAGLRKKLMTLRMARGGARNSAISAGPILRRGQPHPNVPLLRARLGLAQGGDETFDAALETAVKRFQAENDLSGDGVVGAGTRAALNADTDERQRIRILVNMERWRWLPQKLNGEAGIYVWVNIPEFRVRVVKGGAVVFAERAIAGKVDKKTPVFSDQIEWIEFHPTWYVPNSIKVEDILPSFGVRPWTRTGDV